MLLMLINVGMLPRTDAATEKVSVRESVLRKITENSTIATESTPTTASAVVGVGTEPETRKNYLSLSSECLKNGSFILTLQTNEPFLGWIYTRDHQVKTI